MKITKDQLLNFLTDLSLAYELPPLIEKGEEVIEALQNEELEIEGYVRKDHLRDATKMADEWTRLDPNDESTHPKEGTPVLFTFYNPIDKWVMLADIASNDVVDDWKNISRLFGVVFWRKVTFPKPRVVRKIRERRKNERVSRLRTSMERENVPNRSPGRSFYGLRKSSSDARQNSRLSRDRI